MKEHRNYRVSYLDVDEDLTHVTIPADSKEEAESYAKREYWDIASVVQVVKMEEDVD